MKDHREYYPISGFFYISEALKCFALLCILLPSTYYIIIPPFVSTLLRLRLPLGLCFIQHLLAFFISELLQTPFFNTMGIGISVSFCGSLVGVVSPGRFASR